MNPVIPILQRLGKLDDAIEAAFKAHELRIPARVGGALELLYCDLERLSNQAAPASEAPRPPADEPARHNFRFRPRCSSDEAPELVVRNMVTAIKVIKALGLNVEAADIDTKGQGAMLADLVRDYEPPAARSAA